MEQTFVTLNNGIKMPQFGIGTYLLTPEQAENSTLAGLQDGYRMVDTANAYVNEKAVGRAIKKSGISRDQLFVSTKLWPSEYENRNAVDETLARLGLDYVDLLFLHQPAGNWKAGYQQLEEAYKAGKIRSIGISNFEGKYIDELLSSCEIKPQVIQVEAHPYFTQDELRKTLDRYGIKLMAWYPLGHGDKSLLQEKVFTALAAKYRKTPAQIVLRWHIQMGFIVIPGSKNPEHVRDNIDIFDFALTDEEMAEIAKINKNTRYYNRTDAQLVQFASYKPQYEA
jgi:diketogulonate reductase-like aldo/keto reductase